MENIERQKFQNIIDKARLCDIWICDRNQKYQNFARTTNFLKSLAMKRPYLMVFCARRAICQLIQYSYN